MDEVEARLARCFLAVFPDLSADEVTKASSSSVHNWDSVAGVALLSVVEEEFGISIEAEDLATFTSFDGFLGYLREIESNSQVSKDTYA
jgi:acyl carrier protein